MDILGTARRLESTIARTLDNAAQRALKTEGREPLEIVHAVVEAVARKIEPSGRGRHVFPFNRIKVLIAAPSEESRARFEAVFNAAPSLQERIVERFRSAGCGAPELTVKVNYVSKAEAHWTAPLFHLDLARVTPAIEIISQPRAIPVRIGLTVVVGSAEQPAYSFAISRIDLGRCAEVRDRNKRLVRTNHVAFTDGVDALNQSVSRQHAHIEYQERSAEYRLHDDRSAHGTGVLRNGKTIAVHAGSRGVRLQPGDEIVLGEVRLRVDLS